jgi:hypothetical protein
LLNGRFLERAIEVENDPEHVRPRPRTRRNNHASGKPPLTRSSGPFCAVRHSIRGPPRMSTIFRAAAMRT